MLKRFLFIMAAVFAGYGLAQVAARSGAPSWWPDRERDRNVKYFREVMQLVKENYMGDAPAGYDDLTRNALDGMVAKLDPHSQFMTADLFQESEEELSNAFGGVGIQVEQRDNQIVIITPIAGTPAERAGLRQGDRLVKIDGKPVENPSVDKTVRLVRGAPDTEVTLTVYRPSQEKNLDFTMKRERIRLESVRNTMIRPDGIGYLQITQFSERTGEEFRAALAALEKQNLRSLIIDLRNNPGGLLDAAIEVCDEFFEKGELIAYTQGRTPDAREDFNAGGAHTKRDYPIAILVNSGTASAAEIVSGAMKDTKRAVIVGEKTFGKGSVQSIIELNHGEGLRLTTARYYTPSGVTIHERGIQPQIEIEISADDEDKIRLQQSRPDLAGSTEFNDRFGFERIEDVQLNAAEEVLTGVLAVRETKQ
ncbi:S41 family peptidase [Oleiharenicola lentus]|uniref:S41 family peptidase n=1 Tax=Oleiharenicola lentus TaxID=2508720 RepID=UPI003F67C89E